MRGAGRVTAPSLPATLFPHRSVVIQFKDDVTVILILCISIMLSMHFCVITLTEMKTFDVPFLHLRLKDAQMQKPNKICWEIYCTNKFVVFAFSRRIYQTVSYFGREL
jgi:hypothetical protein